MADKTQLEKELDSLKKIKVTLKEYTSPSTNKKVDQEIFVRGGNTNRGFVRRGGVSKVKQSQFEAKPAYYLRLYPALAKYTNASSKQLETIGQLTKQQILSIYG